MYAGVLGGPEGVFDDRLVMAGVRGAEGVLVSLLVRECSLGGAANSISGDPGGVLKTVPDGIVGSNGNAPEGFLGEHSADPGAVVAEEVVEAADVVEDVEVNDFVEPEETERRVFPSASDTT